MEGCMLWGIRFIILPLGWKCLLEQFNYVHLGVGRMKSLVRAGYEY